MIDWVKLICILGFSGCVATGASQNNSAIQDTSSVQYGYRVNYAWSLPVTSVGLFTTWLGHQYVRKKPTISQATLNSLNRQNVWAIDRIALRQDADEFERAREISDLGIKYGPMLPALLLLDRRIRHDWLDYAMVYIESQVVVNNFYNWSFMGPLVVDRFRPVAYYDELDLEERNWGGNRNSFYSGHTSAVATSTFFMAQSYIEYHPEHAHRKWLYYSLATIPPAYIGYKRIQGLKHFPSDVFVGLIVGAAGGALFPRLHRNRKGKQLDLSMTYGSDLKMMRLAYHF